MILFTFLILDFIISLFICIYCPFINVYFSSWYFFLICLLVFIVVFLILVILFALFLIIYLMPVSFNKTPHANKFDRKLVKRACECVMQVCNVRLHVKGLEKLPQDQNFLLVQNHLSNFDVLCTLWAFRYFDFAFIFKESLLKVPLVGKFMYKVGMLAINREDNRKGLRTIVQAMNVIKEGKKCIGVYPEGTRSKTYELAPLHAGTFKIATKTKCPIVISTITNSESIRFHILKPTHVYINVVDVLKYDDYKDLSTEQIAEQVHDMMAQDISTLDLLRDKAYLKNKRFKKS